MNRVVLILIALPICRTYTNTCGKITVLRLVPVFNIDYCETILIYQVFPVVFRSTDLSVVIGVCYV